MRDVEQSCAGCCAELCGMLSRVVRDVVQSCAGC